MPGSASALEVRGELDSLGYDIPMTRLRGELPMFGPQLPALTVVERGLPRFPNSEALTAVPEPRPQHMSLSERADDLLLRLSRNTTTFCASLLVALPIWGAFASFNRFLGHFRLEDSLPVSVFLLAGIMSVLFTRLAWHRYHWLKAAERRKTAMWYAALGLFSGPIVPVVAVAFFIAIKNATSAPGEAPNRESANREIEPP